MSQSEKLPEELSYLLNSDECQNSDSTPRPRQGGRYSLPQTTVSSPSMSIRRPQTQDSVMTGQDSYAFSLLSGPASASSSSSSSGSAFSFQQPGSFMTRMDRLPSFAHISQIADAAVEENSRPMMVPAVVGSFTSQSFLSQSPITQQQMFPSGVQMSPASSYGLSFATSPSSYQTESIFNNSPPFSSFGNIYNPRRQSIPIPGPIQTSNSSTTLNANTTNLMTGGGYSSGDSYGQNSISSLGDSQSSSSRPTPLSSPRSAEMEQRMSIGSLQGSPLMSPNTQGLWQCDFPGCNASPFPTQYLLNSHTTSHSLYRPHFCPVPGCPRGEGGKGFKRKNEMIRHGLTHDTPGYMCPFCPEKVHKYPRPDNLQRHVRVHHIDKDRDDPELRRILSQRANSITGLNSASSATNASTTTLTTSIYRERSEIGVGSESGSGEVIMKARRKRTATGP